MMWSTVDWFYTIIMALLVSFTVLNVRLAVKCSRLRRKSEVGERIKNDGKRR